MINSSFCFWCMKGLIVWGFSSIVLCLILLKSHEQGQCLRLLVLFSSVLNHTAGKIPSFRGCLLLVLNLPHVIGALLLRWALVWGAWGGSLIWNVKTDLICATFEFFIYGPDGFVKAVYHLPLCNCGWRRWAASFQLSVPPTFLLDQLSVLAV